MSKFNFESTTWSRFDEDWQLNPADMDTERLKEHLECIHLRQWLTTDHPKEALRERKEALRKELEKR